MKQKRQIRLDVTDVIKLAQVKMSILFDKKHRPLQLEGNVYFKLAKTGTIEYHVPNQSFLTSKKLGPFPIKRKVGDLAYELALSPSMKIHFVISVIHFEQARENNFERPTSPHVVDPGPIIVDGEEHYIVGNS